MSSFSMSTMSLNISLNNSISISLDDNFQKAKPFKDKNTSIPLWGFPSPCDWNAATYVDVVVSTSGVFNNAMIFLLPFFFSRMYNLHGVFLGSYTAGAFACSLYFLYFDIRVLTDGPSKVEKTVIYALLLFQAYHVVLQLSLLTWDQYKRIFQCNGHMRYLTRARVTKITALAVFVASVHPVVEASFTNNVSEFPLDYAATWQFRLVCSLIVALFFWLIPVLTVIVWNADLFCFLLKVTHNGHAVVEPKEEELKPEPIPYPATPAWPARGQGAPDKYDNPREEEEVAELPTLPDDIPFEFVRSFGHLVLITAYCALLFAWLSYHALAVLLRAGDTLKNYGVKESINNCYVFIDLYFFAKLIPIVNPLGLFYYRKELHKIFCCLIPPKDSMTLVEEQ